MSFNNIIRTVVPLIGMCHLKPLPGEPLYDEALGINHIIKHAKKDIEILQQEGFDGILISNESGIPYTQDVSKITAITMAYVIGKLKELITIPFGIDCMYDAYSTIDLAVATEADFCRISLNAASISDFKFGFTPLGGYSRYASQRSYKKPIIINVTLPVEASPININTIELLKVIKWQTSSAVLCMSASSIENLCDTCLGDYMQLLRELTILCDGGCNKTNIKKISQYTNGIIIGTALKENMALYNPINVQQAKEIIALHKSI